MPERKFPIAQVIRTEHFEDAPYPVVYVRCPFCNREHIHGAPDRTDNAYRRRRASHCQGGDYVIAPVAPRSRLHVLYRFYDESGQLLYVGMTIDPSSRFRSHRYDKAWWDQIAKITLQKYDRSDELARAELHAIRVERPRYNIAGVPKAVS